MEYLTTIATTPYYQWQIELLIESFKLLGKEDELVIGIIDEGLPPEVNLKNHKRVFTTKKEPFNYGSINYGPINQPHLVKFALEQKLISQPFTLIHCDTLLVKPNDTVDSHICCSQSENFLSFLKKENPDINQNVGVNVLPLGAIYQFNDVPIDFFQTVINKMKSLANAWAKNTENTWKLKYGRFANRLAWMSSFLEISPKLRVKVQFNESQLFSPLTPKTEFIHYWLGLASIFQKTMFRGGNITLSDSNPIAILANPDFNFTTSTNYAIKVAKSYLKRIK